MSEQPPKILVVDDVPENVRLLEAVLVSRGYEVVTANDGWAALDLVETEEPDLILLDVMMPASARSRPSAAHQRTRDLTGALSNHLQTGMIYLTHLG